MEIYNSTEAHLYAAKKSKYEGYMFTKRGKSMYPGLVYSFLVILIGEPELQAQALILICNTVDRRVSSTIERFLHHYGCVLHPVIKKRLQDCILPKNDNSAGTIKTLYV